MLLDPDAKEAVDDDRTHRTRRVEALLDEGVRLGAWLELGLPDDLKEHLREQRLEVGLRLLEELSTWHRVGGEILLRGPSASAKAPAMRLVEPNAPHPHASQVEGDDPTQDEPATEEAEREPAPPSTPEPAATANALAALKERLESGAAVPVEQMATDWLPRLQALLAQMPLTDDESIELERLHAVTSRIEVWADYPAHVQRMLLGLVGARLRTLQDEREVRDRRMDGMFGRLTAFSAREQPGAVHGLARAHRPLRESWADDADAWWQRLQGLLPTGEREKQAPNQERLLAGLERLAEEVERAPEVARDAVRSQLVREMKQALAAGLSARDPRLVRLALPLADRLGDREFRTLRRAIRAEIEARREEESEDVTPSALPEDWPWWSKVRGRRAVMLGGSPRELNRARLEETFGFQSLEWEPSEGRRNSLIGIRNRVVSGGVDLVIILGRFVGHDADEVILPACREHGVDWVHVDHGYGVARIRHTIERFLEPEPG